MHQLRHTYELQTQDIGLLQRCIANDHRHRHSSHNRTVWYLG